MGETHVGFTGTRRGMTRIQGEMLRDFLKMEAFALRAGYERVGEEWRGLLHHGDCVGADAQAHRTALATGWDVVIHPPTDEKMWANVAGNGEKPDDRVEVLDPAPYAQRNLTIVDAGIMLIACPGGPEQRRSGTWSTVRAAIRLGRPVVLITPDGDIDMEGMEIHDSLHPR